ncbi:MAG TPA: hypothetical protein PKA06_08955, partial [Gemmatales bacterium]|nr:hypothetical protein [Gemmatales bacterium]
SEFKGMFRLACELYNRALEKCARSVQKLGTLDSRQEIQLPTYDGSYFRVKVTHHGFSWKPEEFGPLLFCNDYTVYGLDNQYCGYGLGVPMIGSRASTDCRPENHRHASNYFKAVHFPVSTIRPRIATLKLHNPLTFQALNIGGYAMPMETDLTTPLAFSLEKTDLATLAYKGFIFANEVERQAGIYMFEPYQKGKIPVLMVHGLLSSPLTWAPLFNDLQADPYLREHYQFWFYLYPSGNPYLVTAQELRNSLNRLRQEVDPQNQDTGLDRMVVVGHSMGGLIGRLLTIEGGDDFWHATSREPLDKLKLSEKTREQLQQMFYFQPVRSVERVVFLGTPHRGSQLSPSFLGRLGKKLVRLPNQFKESLNDIVINNPDAWPEQMREIPTSVDMLDPESPAIVALSHRTKPERVHYHSVIGVVSRHHFFQQMRDLFNWDDAPGDGVVRYDSAHLDFADSETIVRADHMKVHH